MRLPLIFFVFLSPLVASADEFHKLVRYTCDVKQTRLSLEYFGAYNENGEVLDKLKGKNAWSPGDLRGLQPNDPVFSSPKTVKRDCQLSDGIYLVEIKPVPEDFRNVIGQCGDWETVTVRVSKEGKTVLEQQFESGCNDEHSLVVTKIVFDAGKQPAITKIQQLDFI